MRNSCYYREVFIVTPSNISWALSDGNGYFPPSMTLSEGLGMIPSPGGPGRSGGMDVSRVSGVGGSSSSFPRLGLGSLSGRIGRWRRGVLTTDRERPWKRTKEFGPSSPSEDGSTHWSTSVYTSDSRPSNSDSRSTGGTEGTGHL